ncbi:hypothetical protein LTR70_005407 [Exophiala xenobiotica]|uniref:mRNA-capping enzyme subunit beta n=1 Tax=Lithohypha guttulata TaxID=1690604 RepID=A0ABR0K9M0_9EURO|nr:hypothetical protein LTR24_005149 [Lithohypha guttulata]KAK5318385.1 hypothetical protein LTR70_005407 [Exophiala xenobiotica]
MSHQDSLDRQVEPPQPPLLSSSTSMSSMHEHQTLTDQLTRQSPAPLPVVAPREPSPHIDTQSSLKRSASHLSDTKPPPQKRPRGVIPRWAQSARGNRPLRFIDTPQHNPRPRQQIQQRPPPLPQNETTLAPRQNGNPVPAQHAPPQAQGQGWESSIANVVPFENLTRKVCDWIISIIAVRPAPVGSTWEIEAKVGTIRNRQSGERYSNPDVDSEVLMREGTRNTRFESSMNEDQHRILNVYLNGLTEAALKARLQDPSRIEILYNHPKENDEFYELSHEGKAQLNPDLQGWIHEAAGRGHRREVRVRRTTNKVTGEVTAQIIKTRVADKEIYNPDFDFDFRISISLETRWEGAKEHLTQVAENRGRNKDRVSYRHMIYQVDLTQVTYEGSDRKDHELEVEVATESLKQEIERLRRNDANNQVERMVTGLVDNVRLLCRKGSVG